MNATDTAAPTANPLPPSAPVYGTGVIERSAATQEAAAAQPVAGRYVIVRTKAAGCFAGTIVDQRATVAGMVARMVCARRIWYWSGAASLSQMAVDGVMNPSECKFPCPVPKIELVEVVEILDCTERARQSIERVPVWAAQANNNGN